MLGFYGLEIVESCPLTVRRAPSFAVRTENWLTANNHNHLRITRILKSMRTLGLETEATAFFNCLVDIYREESAKDFPGISEETLRFWQAAMRDVGGMVIEPQTEAFEDSEATMLNVGWQLDEIARHFNVTVEQVILAIRRHARRERLSDSSPMRP